MKQIKLTKGKFAIVDDDMFEYLNQWKWHYVNSGYAYHSFKELNWKHIAMHRLINNTPEGFETDHINKNKLDNRKINLRTVTTSENQHNRSISKTSTSGVKGVSWHKRDRYWQSLIRINGKRIYLGSFKNIEEANKIYQETERRYYGSP